jgi:hypothetical protein
MKGQFTITFRDPAENDDAVAILTKHDDGTLSIGLSLKQSGDIQCTFPADKARELKARLEALL